jgi:hypothetical protein
MYLIQSDQYRLDSGTLPAQKGSTMRESEAELTADH